MKVALIVVGKTDKRYYVEAMAEYEKRLKHYCKFEVRVIPDVRSTKSMATEVQLQKEGEAILASLRDAQEVILLDEHGINPTSVDFARLVERRMVSGQRELVFVVGGPYGFHEAVRAKASSTLSLSNMTFSHQLVRLVFMEQLYRAFTIIRGEPYHHQ